MAEGVATNQNWGVGSTNIVDTLLAELLTPDLYRRNPFRVLGLPITASTRTIATHVQKRQVLAELGTTDPSLDGPFPIRPTPSLEDIRKAERELHDPLRRIVHELFWFWPLDGTDGAKDPAFAALKAGDVAATDKIWNEAASNPTTAPIARHNHAVRWHLTALGLEKRRGQTSGDSNERERLLRYWKGAISFWDKVCADDVTWSALSARALALEDDRISLELIQDLRSRTPRALARINAALVAGFASEGRADVARLHISFFENKNLKSIGLSDFCDATIEKLKEGLRAFLRANDPGFEGHESSGADAASTLIGALGAYCACFEALEDAASDDSWRDTVDEVIRRANQYAVAYATHTHDNARLVTLLRSAAAYVSGPDLFKLLDTNTKFAVEQIAGAYLEPYFVVLKQVMESSEPPKDRLSVLNSRVIAHVPEIQRKLAEIGQPGGEFTNSIAAVLRGIAVDAWNDAKDAATATSALNLAEQFVVDKELSEALKTDRASLQQLLAASAKEAKEKQVKRIWGAVAVVVILFLIYIGNTNQGTSTSSTVPATAAQSAANSTSGAQLPRNVGSDDATGGSAGIYLVPHTYDSELEHDREEVRRAQAASQKLDERVDAARQLVEAKQSAVERLKAQADLLGEAIETQRPIVSRDDSTAVEEFNGQVSRYNQLISRARRLNAEANRAVRVYNELVDEARAQTAASNRLVDAYNAKLARYGNRQ